MQFLPFRKQTTAVAPTPSIALPESFRGTAYRLADNWYPFVQPDGSKPIRYAEIGTFYGANLISVAMTYGAHPDSVLVAIDPWTDYSEYPEYKGQQETIYDTFTQNVSGFLDKIVVKRGYSNDVLPTLEDNSFDMIYIDGNHESEYVLEDAVLAFRKVKSKGYMIFDDYGWGGPNLTQRGIDAFLSGYHRRVTILGTRASQVFVQKK
jgi:predicted O-methyltransferase YrrM